MEGCLLCFQNHKEYVGYIQANSTHWMELNVHNIIEKHLWSIECIQPYSWICKTCWKVLFEFNSFYMMIKQRHNKQFDTLNSMIMDNFQEDKPIIECQYERETLFQQNITETLQRNTADNIAASILEIDKVEDNPVMFVYEPERPQQEEMAVNEIIICDEQENNSLLYNSQLTRDEQTSNQTSFNSNMEEEDLIAHVIYMKPTKRKRGRPRKDSKDIGIKPQNTIGVSNNNTSFNSKNNLGRPAKNSEKYFENMNRMKRLWENRSTTRPIRKRKLPRKFLTNNGGSGEISNSLALKNRKLYAFVKTVGKRGRPRKVLLSNISQEEMATANAKGKRGRPRKIFTNNLEESQDQMNSTCDETVSSGYENEASLILKNKPGRPRKEANNLTGGKKEFWSNKMSARPKRERKLNRKYFTNNIKVTERFLIPKTTEDMPGSSVLQKPSIKSELREICNKNVPLKNIGKRGRPKKMLNNEANGAKNTQSSFKNVKTLTPAKNFFSNLKHIKTVRPYKDVMKNYIATSVRCMQIFKPKTTALDKSENTKAVEEQ